MPPDDDLPTKRIDLSADDFPFTVEAISSQTGKIVWSRVVTGPDAIFVPPLRG